MDTRLARKCYMACEGKPTGLSQQLLSDSRIWSGLLVQMDGRAGEAAETASLEVPAGVCRASANARSGRDPGRLHHHRYHTHRRHHPRLTPRGQAGVSHAAAAAVPTEPPSMRRIADAYLDVVPAALEVRLVQPPPWWIGEIELPVAVRSARQSDHPALAGTLAHRRLDVANCHADTAIAGAVASRGVNRWPW